MEERHRYCLALPEKRHRGGEGERPKLRLRRIAGVGLGLFQMIQYFLNDFLFGDEGDDAQVATAGTDEGVSFVNPPDQIGPTFSEGGTMF